MKKLGFLMGVVLIIAACSSQERAKIDQEIEEDFQKRCEFDNITFEKFERGTPAHTFCVELWRSGIDPDEIYNINGGGRD